MVDRFYGYQYDTNPKKLSQNSIPYNKKYSKKDEPVVKKKVSNSNRNSTTNSKNRKNTEKNMITKEKSAIQPKQGGSKKTQNNVKNIGINKKTKKQVKNRIRIIAYLVTTFSFLLAISYQNSLVNESFNRKEQYKKELEALSKTNQQLEVNIENNLNFNSIEQMAKERLGMQKLTNSQKIYVTLEKEDYIAPAAEKIIMDEDLNFWQKIFKGFMDKVR